MIWSRVGLSAGGAALLGALGAHLFMLDVRLLGVGVIAALACLLLGAVAVMFWRWEQRGVAVATAGLVAVQAFVTLRQFGWV
ncbi:hypothetical protein [Deinococcus seoulensis]|nr:hypothetical protein [Deinococcus seoulensis]